MTATYYVADVFDGLAKLEDGSVDLVVTSPPFLALRSYLPADHPLKAKEIGSEPTPAAFLDVMLAFTAELRRVLAPHGSICVELGDTFAASGGAGGDYAEDGLREGQPTFRQQRGSGWPLSKCKAMIPELYRIALAYGINPLTGLPSPAGQWRVRNVVTWARPNPPVGALGDKWRPATSDVVVACVSSKRYWDDLATRKLNPRIDENWNSVPKAQSATPDMLMSAQGSGNQNPSGAPLLDYWVIPPGGYTGSHYAVFPPELVVPLVKAMCPEKVCRECGGWTDCGHNDFRPGLVLDCFGGSGTVGVVATGHGHDCVLIDIDERNYELALERIGPFMLEGPIYVGEQQADLPPTLADGF